MGVRRLHVSSYCWCAHLISSILPLLHDLVMIVIALWAVILMLKIVWVCGNIVNRGCTKEIHCTRPHDWTAWCTLVWDWPSTTVHRNGQLWRRADLEDRRISPTQVAGSRRPNTLSLFAAVLHIPLWIQDVCTHLSQRWRCWTRDTPVAFLCRYAGNSCMP